MKTKIQIVDCPMSRKGVSSPRGKDNQNHSTIAWLSTASCRVVCRYPGPFQSGGCFLLRGDPAHEKVLDRSKKDALTALEMLTHRTQKNPTPVMPLEASERIFLPCFAVQRFMPPLDQLVPSPHSSRSGKSGKNKHKQKGRNSPSAHGPPRSWNKSTTLYAGQWKERTERPSCSKCGQALVGVGSRFALLDGNSLGCRDGKSLHLFDAGTNGGCILLLRSNSIVPGKIEKHVTTQAQTKMCAVDLNLHEHSQCAPFKLLKVRSSPPIYRRGQTDIRL